MFGYINTKYNLIYFLFYRHILILVELHEQPGLFLTQQDPRVMLVFDMSLYVSHPIIFLLHL